MELINMGVLHLQKLNTHADKLKRIFERTLALIDEYKPDELAVEAPFFGKNVQSMLKLGRAQGVAIAAALYRDIPIYEYAPKKIKMAITGKGTASKEQVAAMLKSILNIKELQAIRCHRWTGSGSMSLLSKRSSGARKIVFWVGVFLKK